MHALLHCWHSPHEKSFAVAHLMANHKCDQQVANRWTWFSNQFNEIRSCVCMLAMRCFHSFFFIVSSAAWRQWNSVVQLCGVNFLGKGVDQIRRVRSVRLFAGPSVKYSPLGRMVGKEHCSSSVASKLDPMSDSDCDWSRTTCFWFRRSFPSTFENIETTSFGGCGFTLNWLRLWGSKSI